MGELLIVTAVPAEAQAILGGAAHIENISVGPYTCQRWAGAQALGLVVASGVGPAASAAATATVLALHPGIDLALSAGIGGGFEQAGIVMGDVVLATHIHFADLGAHSPEKFLDAEALGWSSQLACPAATVQHLEQYIAGLGLRVRCGPIATVASATGTDERAAELFARFGPLAEGMEGAGVAAAAVKFGVPALEVRAISNRAGKRNREAWDIPGALKTLERIALINWPRTS